MVVQVPLFCILHPSHVMLQAPSYFGLSGDGVVLASEGQQNYVGLVFFPDVALASMVPLLLSHLLHWWNCAGTYGDTLEYLQDRMEP